MSKEAIVQPLMIKENYIMARNTNTAKKVDVEVAAEAGAKTEVVKSAMERIAEVDLSSFTTKSAAIRHLKSLGFETADIARRLQIKYQHVRNVLTQPAPKAKTVEVKAVQA